MDYIIIDRRHNGYRITDSIHNSPVFYYGYSFRDAIAKHRRDFGLTYKRLHQIYI